MVGRVSNMDFQEKLLHFSNLIGINEAKILIKTFKKKSQRSGTLSGNNNVRMVGPIPLGFKLKKQNQTTKQNPNRCGLES